MAMASEEPMFDPSLKKKKKKNVAFFEDPLGADADPTTPAPLDEGPTVHEQIATSGRSEDLDVKSPSAVGENEDFNTMFGDLKKKPKKKLIPMDLGDEGSGASTPTEGLEDFSGLKKKKKKKDLPLDLGEDSGMSTPVAKEGEEAANGDGAIPADDLNFLSGIKKKKKKKALEDFERELDGAQGGDVDGTHLDNMDEAELGDDVFASGGEARSAATNEEPWAGSDRDYAYPELLNRFYSLLHAQNPALLSSAGKKYSIAPPSIHREGNKKSIFANVTDICKRMRRTPEHVIAFMFAEMGTTGSVDGSGRLVIKGRFQQKQVENILRKYIVEYVTCKTCRSPDTALTKENRIFFVECESCGSRRSVNAIKSGFQAQVGRRSKNKPT